MKKYGKFLSLFIISLYISVIFSGIALASNDRVTVAILEFRDNSGRGAPASAIQDVLVGVMARIKHFSVVERSQLDSIAREHRLSASGLTDENTALELGRLSGVKYLVTGSITEYSYQNNGVVIPIKGIGLGLGSQVAKVAVDLRVINTQTGEITLTLREQGAADQVQGAIVTRYGGAFTGEGGGLLSTATFNCAKKLAFELQNKLLGDKGAAAVLNSDGREITCNIGELNGSVSVGDVLIAYRNGRTIKDIDGKVLDTEKILLCVFKIKNVQPNYSTGELVKGCLPRRGAFVTRAPKGWKELSYAKEDDSYEKHSSGSDINALMEEMKKREEANEEPERQPAEQF